VNGALGKVKDIVWSADVTNYKVTPPLALLIEFDGYHGPALITSESGSLILPVFRSTRDFLYNSTSCSRTQFPIAVAYAITVHKSQGLTLNDAVLNITDKDFSPGLTYVAVSRVKELSGIMFEESFDYDRFKPSTRSSIVTARDEDAERRRAQHIQDPPPVTPSRSYPVRTQSTPPSPLTSSRTHGAAQLLSTASSAISSPTYRLSLRHSRLGQ
jgi:ATP-dependent exoDNAse (exonuclease V) alpha subunit